MIPDILIRNYVAFRNKGKARKSLTPLPVSYWEMQQKNLQKYSSKKDVLIPSANIRSSQGENISIAALKDTLKGMKLGTWTLDQDSIEVLWKFLKRDHPDIILECGSGLSTLMFSRFFQKYHPTGKIISFEQGEEEKVRVERLLDERNLNTFATILYTPLDTNGRYQFDLQQLKMLLNEKQANWMLIDGPCGPTGCRDNILSEMLPFLAANARWWMDDSFRDGELSYLKDWEQNNQILIEGIYPVGKGLGTGRVK